MKVEELKMYGKALEMPKQAVRKQAKIVFGLLRKEFGLLGLIPVMFGMKKHKTRINKEFPDAVNRARRMSKVMAEELLMMGSLFSAVADKRGRKFACELLTKMMQNVAHISMPALYQLPDLLKCEGDVFENFKKMNKAMFAEIDRLGTWKSNCTNETDDLLEIKVNSCANIELFEAIGCPELSSLGCDHDLAGYPLIEEAAQCDFRRKCTLAKGGDCCHFEFYRKGTAPFSADLNK